MDGSATHRPMAPAGGAELRAPAVSAPGPAAAVPAPRRIIISKPSEVPAHIGNLSAIDGDVPLRTEDRKVCSILDLGERRATILWDGVPAHREVVIGAETRLRANNYTIAARHVATADIIALTYEKETFVAAQETAASQLETTASTQLFDAIVQQALARGSSDIHVMMGPKTSQVRARINGELIELRELSRPTAEAMCRAMFSQADVDSRIGKTTFNERECQDASVTRNLVIDGRLEQVKIRWASGPVWPDAFDVTLRLLTTNTAKKTKTLSNLGFTPDQCDLIEEALRAPTGAIILAGSTGSGKSTTNTVLADMWIKRFKGTKLLRTIEDPPEYVIPGARQTPANRSDKDTGLADSSFNKALRAAMRMDPDAILVGEIRDGLTAELTQQAIQTGHKVFTTVHAGSPFGALTRLEDLGLARARMMGEGFLSLIIYQILVPLLCEHCSRPLNQAEVPPDLWTILRADLFDDLEKIRLRGQGCQHCENGHRGRTVLAEMLMPDKVVRHAMLRQQDMLAEAYWRGGMVARHGATQALSNVDHAKRLIVEGRLSPVDADLALGKLRDESSSAEEREYYERESRKGIL